MVQQVLNFRGLRCPMPIVKLSLATKNLEPGATVRVEATDAAFRSDLEAWTRRMGFVVRQFSDGDVKSALIEKV